MENLEVANLLMRMNDLERRIEELEEAARSRTSKRIVLAGTSQHNRDYIDYQKMLQEKRKIDTTVPGADLNGKEKD